MKDPSVPVARLAYRLVQMKLSLFVTDLLLGGVFFLVGLVPGLLFRRYFDELEAASAASMTSAVLLPLALLVAVKLVHVCLGAGWMAVDTWFRFGVAAQLRRTLTTMALRSGRGAVVTQGDFLTRYRDDVTEVAEYLGKRGLLNLTSCLAFSAAALGVLFSISASVTALAVLPTLLLTIATSLIGRRAQALHRESREAAAETVSILRDGLTSVQALKIALAETSFVDRYLSASDRRRRADVRETLYHGLIQSSSGIVVALGTGLIMVVSSAQLRSGAFSIGDLALFLYCLGDVGAGVAVAGIFVGKTRQVRVAAGRLDEVTRDAGGQGVEAQLGTRLPMDEQAVVLPPLERFEVREVSLDHGGRRVLDDVSFAMGRGELVVVSGRTGAGKSTLLEVIAGLVTPGAGSIRWNGTPLEGGRLRLVRGIAYLPQTPRLFEGTVRDNIAFGRDADDAQITRAARIFLLTDDIAAWPRGLTTEVGRGGRAVSGGQLLRIAGARMLLRDAQLLLIDDVSSGLDAATEASLWRALRAETDAAIIVVSNRPAIADRADLQLRLDDGKIVHAVRRRPMSSP